jgi:hypothetical protein
MLRGLGINGLVVPKMLVEDGISAVRSILGCCWFDAEKCARGLKALKSYRTEYNPKAAVFRATPLHDWTSHAADAFRYLALGLEKIERKSRPRSPVYAETISGNFYAL